jgi:uncharacterized protein (TIGR02996 family)
MDTESALLQAIIDHPADDLPRLVYADFLEEHGRPERAEFIREDIALAGLAACGHPPARVGAAAAHSPACEVCRRRCRVLALFPTQRIACGAGLYIPAPQASNTFNHAGWSDMFEHVEADRPVFIVRRGFVGCVFCRGATWLARGPGIVRRQPVVRVETVGLMERDSDGGTGRCGASRLGPLWPLAFPDAAGTGAEGPADAINDRISAAAIPWAKSQPA